MDSCVKSIMENEGFRSEAYYDTKGVLTIGDGTTIKTLIDLKLIVNPAIAQNKEKAARFIENLYFSRSLAELNLRYIVSVYSKALFGLLKESGYNPDKWAPGAYDIILEMAYQIGVHGALKFNTTLKMVERFRYYLAADAMLDSKWAKIDSPERAKKLSERMRNI